MTVKMTVRDVDLGLPAHDGCRLELVADGLPLFGGVQLSLDTTLVSPLHCDGSARQVLHRWTERLLPLRHARRKGRTLSSLGPCARARLVVLAGEVGVVGPRRLRLLAHPKDRSEPRILRGRVEQALRVRWASILACSAGRAFAASLVNLKLGVVLMELFPSRTKW